MARYLPRAGLVEAPLPDGGRLRMWSRGDDDVATTVYWRGWAGFEPETSKTFYELARAARVTLDIGAHVGYFSLLAALANRANQVFAFEPLAPVRERLLRNLALNGVENVSCLPVALGSDEGTAPFFHVADGLPSSSSLSRDFMRSIVAERRLMTSEVDVTTVDRFAEDHGLLGKIDLVKVDTEATEDDVLRGMVRTLEADRPAVICEVLRVDTAQRIEQLLTPLRYRFLLLTDAGPVRCESIRPRSRWRNFCFLPD